MSVINQTRHLLMRLVAPRACFKSLHISSSITLKGREAAHRINTSHKFTPAACNRLMSSNAAQKFEVINIQSDDDFKTRVLKSKTPVVVDFHATWCGPCKLLGPRLESLLSAEQGKVVMAKVDIDDLSDLAMEYGVRSVPTVIAVKNGKILDQFIGLQDDDQIKSFIDKLVVS